MEQNKKITPKESLAKLEELLFKAQETLNSHKSTASEKKEASKAIRSIEMIKKRLKKLK